MVGKHENEHYTSFSPGTSTSNFMLYKVTIEKLIVLTYYPGSGYILKHLYFVFEYFETLYILKAIKTKGGRKYPWKSDFFYLRGRRTA